MKVKLLKKIRKKYGWFINKYGFPVLVNHQKKTANVIDESYYKDYFGMKQSEEIMDLKVSIYLVCYRLMKTIMMKEFGYSFEHINYTRAKNLSRKNKCLTTIR